MKVKDLIVELEMMDPNARVHFMSQPNWPFEYSVRGVTTRADFTEIDPEDPDGLRKDSEGVLDPNDVFLVEGRQLRYGSKDAWDVV